MDQKPSSQIFCSKAWTSFEVEHDGTVAPCCMSKVVCGNVTKSSIAELWNGEGFREFRRKMAQGQWQDICRPECPRLRGAINDSVESSLSEVFADNYQKNLAEIANRTIVLESWPRIWKATASTLCNLDCIMCYQDRNDLRVLPSSFFEEIATLYPFMQEMQLIGGEPFAIKRLRTIMAEFPKERYPDAKFSIVTNGTVHDDKTVDLVAGLNVSWMSISIDAASAPTYERIRRGGNFENTMNGVRKFIALGRKKGFPVHIAFCVMSENLHEVAAFAQLGRELGADVLFGRVSRSFYVNDQHLIDEEKLKAEVQRAKALVAPPAPMHLANLTLSALVQQATR